MDSRFATPNTAAEIDAAYSRMYGPAIALGGEQPPQSQPSLLDLNGVLLIVMGGLASLFTAAAILISAH